MLAVLIALILPAATSSLSAAPSPVAATSVVACSGENAASTTVWTPDNDIWFDQLIRLNPKAAIVVAGRGITVTNPSGVPLVLPAGDVPGSVRLYTTH